MQHSRSPVGGGWRSLTLEVIENLTSRWASPSAPLTALRPAHPPSNLMPRPQPHSARSVGGLYGPLVTDESNRHTGAAAQGRRRRTGWRAAWRTLHADPAQTGTNRLFIPFIFADPALSPCLSPPTTGSLVVPKETI
jgi:hypothetical protein